MFLKAKNLYYKVSDNLSIRFDNLVSIIEPEIPYSSIILEETDGYTIDVNYASAFIHKYQVELSIQDVISSIFKGLISDIKITFYPRDTLKIHMHIGFIPVKVEGKLEINKKNDTILYKFTKITAMGLPVGSIFDAINSIPGVSLALTSEDGKVRVENNVVEIFIREFIPELKANFSLTELYFTDDGLYIELSGKKISNISNNFSFDLPESYVYLIGDRIKINKIEISDAKIVIFKLDGSPFAVNLNTYIDLVKDSVIEYTAQEEVLIKLNSNSHSIIMDKK